MDTRFWGPDGWRLFHSIVVGYPTNPTKLDKQIYQQFFESVGYVLPCIYCRNSFNQYIKELPLENWLDSRIQLSKWLYQIHHKVNQKLLNQGLYVDLNNDFNKIHQHYLEYVKQINQNKCKDIPGWDIIYCILFNYPLQKDKIDPIRHQQYIVFFNTLSYVIPFQKFRNIYREYLRNNPLENQMNRRLLKLWGYQLEQHYCQQIMLDCPSFKERCYSIELFRAGCNGKNDPKPTCHIGSHIKNN